MNNSQQNRQNDLDSFRSTEPELERSHTRRRSGGFVDLGNESQYGTGGHQASGANEIFADVQGDVPWWKSNFFISQPVLFGTWDGVFTSCLLNIFGVIVFLRTGWIVAQAGLINAILIIIFTVFIALISVLSAVGICERCRIESGGVYFLLSHTLGARMGSALGILYCFGQAVGCALNVFGFGESMSELLGVSGSGPWAARGLAVCAIVLLCAINVAGVTWVIKLQFGLLLVILLAALDFFLGSFLTQPNSEFKGWLGGTMGNNTWSEYTEGYTWFRCFGVFFPTVTGILAGINMSGDLKNPTYNIPTGSLAAITTGTVLYMLFAVTLAGTVSRAGLRTNLGIAAAVSWSGAVLVCGLYVSALSSCVGALYGAPRVLQRVAAERSVVGLGALGAGRGPNRVPVRAMVLVGAVGVAFVLVGDINVLAPIVTMPFLLTYAAVDYSYFALAQTFDLQREREMRFDPGRESGPQVFGATGSDLDLLFPERIRHKAVPSSESSSSPEGGVGVGSSGTGPGVHSKTSNWYSHLCNRWLSLFGAVSKLLVMLLVNWVYALGCVSAVWLLWLYIGATNPAPALGAAHHFRLLPWLRACAGRACGYRPTHSDRLVVTTVSPTPHLLAERLNDDNHDFAERRRYHHSTHSTHTHLA